jgi:hypothetical protein
MPCFSPPPPLSPPTDTLLQYDAFLESATSSKSEDEKVAHVRDIFGFFMGFRKDQPVADSTENILLRGGKNLHQGESRPAAHWHWQAVDSHSELPSALLGALVANTNEVADACLVPLLLRALQVVPTLCKLSVPDVCPTPQLCVLYFCLLQSTGSSTPGTYRRTCAWMCLRTTTRGLVCRCWQMVSVV